MNVTQTLRARRLELLEEIHKEEVIRIKRERGLTKYEAFEVSNMLRIVRENDEKSDRPEEAFDRPI